MRKNRTVAGIVGGMIALASLMAALPNPGNAWQKGHSPNPRVSEMWFIARPSWDGAKVPCTLYGMKDGSVSLLPSDADARAECTASLRSLPADVKAHFASWYGYRI